MMTQRHYIRQPAGISVIPFDAPEAIEIAADVVDLSDGGLGIMAHHPVDACFVLVREKTGGRKGGMVVWSRELDERTYLAGIQFVPAHPARNEERQEETQLPLTWRRSRTGASSLRCWWTRSSGRSGCGNRKENERVKRIHEYG